MLNKNQTALELLLKGLDKFAKERAEAESRKSPEQRAYEVKRSELLSQEFAQEKIKKEHVRCDHLFRDWIKRDTWLIYDEAMPLINSEKPESETILNPRDSALWELVLSCANHSLRIVNFESKPKQWRVKPFEWVRWLREKGFQVHPQLLNLIYPKSNIAPTIKTTKANNSREIQKAHRQKSIKAFASQIPELARKRNIEWNNQALPVTKKEFLAVFYELNPAIKKISADSFDCDIAEIGIKFQRGIKSNKINKLKLIFNKS